MRIVIDPGTFDCCNLGDLAMLQVAVERLRALWPTAALAVLTDDAAALARHCPQVRPVANVGARAVWFSEAHLLGHFDRYLPERTRRAVRLVGRVARRRVPAAWRAVAQTGMWLRQQPRTPLDECLDALASADLLVVAGQATIADAAGAQARLLLDTAECVLARGGTVVMPGQGIGPIHDPGLRCLAARVLRATQRVGLREARAGPAILAALGVPSDRVVVTGDDALEPAYLAQRGTLGRAVGVHVRRAPLALRDADELRLLRGVIHGIERRYGVPLVALPVSMHRGGTDDARAIADVLDGAGGVEPIGDSPATPGELVDAVGRCRVVITGAYHAAVFALAQGIPAICLGRSDYYIQKFLGLADQFGEGCEVIRLEQGDPAGAAAGAFDRLWSAAPELRAPLRRAAARQIALGRRFYEELRDVVRDGRNDMRVLAPAS